jgi:hypothetical protein
VSSAYSTLSVFAPIFAGVAFGIASRSLLSSTNDVSKFATVLNNIALKVLLPFFLIEAFVGVSFSVSMLFAIGVGFCLPLLTYLLLGLVWRNGYMGLSVAKHFDDLRLAASTFGGGSRGTALIVLLFAANAEFNDYLKWFALIDLGNFLCLLTAVSFLIRRQYGANKSKEKPFFKGLLNNYAVIAFSITGLYFLLRHYFSSIDFYLSETVQFRKLLFSTLVFWAISMQFRVANTKNLVVDASLMMFGRIASATLLIPIHFVFPLPKELVVAIGILLLMPPSSMVPAMISDAGASSFTSSYVNSLIGATNLFYAFLVMLGVILLLSSA